MTTEQSVEEIVEDITSRIDYISCDDGWMPIIANLHTQLLKLDPSYQILQIKEKFGGLRYYAAFSPAHSAAGYALIADAEKLAFRTCEMCGVDGATLRTERSWVKTMCDDCNSASTPRYAS